MDNASKAQGRPAPQEAAFRVHLCYLEAEIR
jgi:hypothetical protein